MRVALVLVATSLAAACATPYAPRGGLGGYQDQQLGKDRYQVTIGANEYTDRGTALEYLHRRANELCGGRAYTTSNTELVATPPREGVAAMFSEEDATTVSAIVECAPRRADEAVSELAPDGRPYCPELDPELEKLRPEGYVSPEDGNCVPRPRPEKAEWKGPAEAPTRNPVTPAGP